MELTTVYKVFRIVREGGAFGVAGSTLVAIREGNNSFDMEHEAMQWIEEREPQERYHEFVVLPIYSMV
ncbi:MAG TPA: hypothetical protein VGO58_04840 [Chitinophagaceae bacterium]|jgi:hypothetical protein|nr:hypothetical protein [Chitinophagaceae bacterium]